MSFRIDNEKLIEKYKAKENIKIEDLTNIEWNTLPVCDEPK